MDKTTCRFVEMQACGFVDKEVCRQNRLQINRLVDKTTCGLADLWTFNFSLRRTLQELGRLPRNQEYPVLQHRL